MRKGHGHAVVVGGGVGGLLAGQVLGPWFERVTVVERDGYPSPPVPRRGAPQGRCLHLLMAGGLAAFERMLPGFGAELAAAGAVPFDFGAEAALRFPHGWLPRFRSGITTYGCSRGLLEEVVRRRVLRDGPVRTLEGHAVTSLAVGEGSALPPAVTGVRLRGEDGEVRALDADLVVVADGAGSALPGWLAELGLPASGESVVDSPLHYTSAWLSIPGASGADHRFLSVSPAASGPPRSGALLVAEEERWAVVLLGPKEEAAPADHRELLHAAGRLADGALQEAIAGSRPIGPVVHHGRSRSRIHHHERAPCWPERLVAVGDAVCALDPYFGLGMTACARGIELLAAHLAGGLGAGDTGDAPRFQEALADTNAVPWELVTGRDRLGRTDAGRAFALEMLQRIAPESPAATRVLLERMHLLAPPEALDAPEVSALVHAALGRSAGAGSLPLESS